MPAVTPHEVTTGFITAFPVEGAAALRVLEDVTASSHPRVPDRYFVGRVPSGTPGRSHSVAVLMMPRDDTRLAATSCADMLRTFPNVQTVIVVGIAAGIPRPEQPERHVRLGDVVVAIEGIVEYGHIRGTDAGPVLRGRQGGGLLNPRLLQAVTHPLRPEPAPAGDMPQVHYGTIGSADVLMKSEHRRDDLAAQYSDVFAVEMEGSGIAAATAACGRTWFMVRGVADYAATGKNGVWHAYASYAAAVWTRALLAVTHPLAEPQAMVAEAALPLVDPVREIEVVGLLNQVPHDTDLRTIWAATVPDHPEPNPVLFTSAPAVYHHLARLNARPDVPHPAFRFADRLGHALSGEHGRALRDWAARQTGSTTEPVLATPGPADTHNGKVRPSLTLQITVDGLDRDRCRITPYLQAASGSWRPAPGPGEPVVTTVDGLARVTAKLVAEAKMRWQGLADRADIGGPPHFGRTVALLWDDADRRISDQGAAG
jgi:nucleoside phosphorylase